MTAGAAQILLKTADLVPGGRTVIAGQGPLLYLAAIQLARAGAPPVAVLETTPPENYAAAVRHVAGWWAGRRDLGKGLAMIAELRRLGVPVRRGVRGLRAVGRRGIESVAWHGGEIAADHLLLHEGVIPNAQISQALQLAHVWDEAQRCWRPAVDEWGRTSLPSVSVAGDAAGIAGAGAAVSRGGWPRSTRHICWAISTRRSATAERRHSAPSLARDRAIRPFLDALYRPADPVLCPADDVIVCRCEEITAGQIRRAVRLGAQGPNQVKAFIRCGMGPCQGRLCGPVASAVIARARGVPIEEVGTYGLAPLTSRLPSARWPGLQRTRTLPMRRWRPTASRRRSGEGPREAVSFRACGVVEFLNDASSGGSRGAQRTSPPISPHSAAMFAS